MKSPTQLSLLALLTLPPLPAVLARTDLAGCTSFTSTVTVNPSVVGYGNVYPSVVWYDPGSLEICRAPECGGGRAPPKTDVPGCPLYSGTELPTPSFLAADPLAPATTAGVVSSAVAAETTGAVVEGTTSDVNAETNSAVAAETTAGATAAEEAGHTLESASHAVTVVSLTGTTAPGPVTTADTTVVSGVAQATGAGPTHAGGNATGAAAGASGSAVVTAAGDMLRAGAVGLSVALAVAAAFVV